MSQFCEELRAERERQGVSLEAISWSTKISQRHLQALEDGELQLLPGGVFRKGFVRSYLGALGLNQAVWMERFEAEMREAGVAEPSPAVYEELARNIARARGMDEPDARLRWSGVVAMVMLLLAFGWCVWHFALAGRVSIAGRAPAAALRSAGADRANAANPRSTAVCLHRMQRFAAAKPAA